MAFHACQKVMDCLAYLREWSHEAAERGFHTSVFAEVGGFALPASVKGNSDLPTIYLSTGIHGDEPSGPQAILELLQEGFFDERYHWMLCPILNPTGLVAGTRENWEGIDLNRDYKSCETQEVRGHIAWLQNQPVPSLFLSLHEDWESSGFYYYEINLGADGPKRDRMLGAVAPFFAAEPEMVIDDHAVTEPGWIYHSEHPDLPEGWPEAIYLAKLGCPLSLTFETPSSDEFEKRVQAHKAAVKRAIEDVGIS